VSLFETVDILGVQQGRPNQIKPLHDGVLGCGVDFEYQNSGAEGDRLAREINCSFLTASAACQSRVILMVQFDQQQPTVRRILAKNVAKSRRAVSLPSDNRPESSLLNGPDGMLAAGAAAEVCANYQDRSSGGVGLIEREFGSTNIHEEQLPVAKPGDSAEEPGRDNAVGVDLIARQHRNFARVHSKSFHTDSIPEAIMSRMPIPSLENYLAETGGNRRYTLSREILGDTETPVSAYWKLCHDAPLCFLLESVTGGENVGRYSVIGWQPKRYLRAKNGQATIDGLAHSLPEGSDPLDLLAEVQAHAPRVHQEGLPPFTAGAVGFLAYDIVRYFERLPDTTVDDLNLDDLAMMEIDDVVVFDHAKNLVQILVDTDGSEAGYAAGVEKIAATEARLREPLRPLPTGSFPVHPVEMNVTRETFEASVSRMKEYIAAGDGVQMVPSQRFATKCEAHPLTLYRALRSINPSPYMFLIRFGEFDLIGASPEILVSLQGDQARVRPIAGTRWRGKTMAEDLALEKELLADEKERAEHVMLVDLGRNDLGRVCEYGTVRVNDLMVIERYSHVMHIVSDVTGTLRAGKSPLDLIRATFPAGTVSGAPKIRAMQIIDELEPTRRGFYAGAVGYLSRTGNLDLCITLRTILLKDGVAYVQAGGGVVYDSVPTLEYEESRNKARASLKAIETAQRGLDSL